MIFQFVTLKPVEAAVLSAKPILLSLKEKKDLLEPSSILVDEEDDKQNR